MSSILFGFPNVSTQLLFLVFFAGVNWTACGPLSTHGQNYGQGTLSGFRIESNTQFRLSAEGQVTVIAGRYVTLRLFSSKDYPFSSGAQISFTVTEAVRGTNCDDLRQSEIFNLTSVQGQTALVDVLLYVLYPPRQVDGNLRYLMFCVRQVQNGNVNSWIHQGNDGWLMIAAGHLDQDTETSIPIWGNCILIVVFISLSGLFTGLGMTMLSLTRLELKTLRSLGSSLEKQYAKVTSVT